MSKDYRRAAAALGWKVQPFVSGQYRATRATKHYELIAPATERVLASVPVGDASDVDEAVRSARRRFDDGCWSGLSPGRRSEILQKLADLIVQHRDEIALLDSLEMGKPISAAVHDAGQFAPGLLRSWAGFATQLAGESAPLSAGTMWINTYAPRGVVGAITPWNFPIVNAVYKVGPALAAGNTVVLKPSELSPSSALRLAELALEAGVPEGVFNVVPGLGSTVGAALALHPEVDMVGFTGSTATGRKIMELAGRSNGKPLLLECGGKSPQIVFDDVTDLDAVAAAIALSFLWNSGQVCSARTRLLVQETLKDSLLDKVIARARQYSPGDPLDVKTNFGPLASPVQRDRVKRYIESGVQAGARAVLLGEVRDSGGCYVGPTIFDAVDRRMAIAREEIFGPVLCLQTFSSDEEAIELANATEYGLSATVWTRDMARGRRIAHGVRAGYVNVRTSGQEEPPSGFHLSYEAQKASGFGAEMGLGGLKAYSTLKSVQFVGN